MCYYFTTVLNIILVKKLIACIVLSIINLLKNDVIMLQRRQ